MGFFSNGKMGMGMDGILVNNGKWMGSTFFKWGNTQSNRCDSQPNCPDAQFAHTAIGETYGWAATVAPRAEEQAFRSGLYVLR